jgi:hypothetical protein
MYKKVFLDHWIDWTIAIIVMVFIVVYGAVVQFNIEQDIDVAGNDASKPIKSNINSIASSSSGTLIVDTSGWKTYQNAKYGFQLEYPADWGDARPISATLPSDMLVSDFIVAFEIEQGRIARGYSFEISLIDNLKNETFVDIKAEMTRVIGTRGTVQAVNIGGKEMLQFTNANPGEYAVALGYTILTPDQKAILNIAFSGEQKPSAEISNRIISSLKFSAQ